MYKSLLLLVFVLCSILSCKEKDSSVLSQPSIQQLDSTIQIRASFDSGFAPVTIKLEKRLRGISISSYMDDTIETNSSFLIENYLDYHFVVLDENESFVGTCIVKKNTDKTYDKVYQRDEKYGRPYFVAGNNYQGRAKLWNTMVFDLFISHDSVEYGEHCTIRVLQNDRGYDASFQFIRKADGMVLKEMDAKQAYLEFSIPFDGQFTGVQNYLGVLLRKTTYDLPMNGKLGIISDTIPVRIFWEGGP